MPKTSGCSPADFAHVYDRIHAEQPDATILHLAYSEVTTCSHQSSKIAAKGRDYVFSMDTRFVSVGQSLVAVETAKYIEAHPDATVDEIFAFTNSVMDRVLLGFVRTTFFSMVFPGHIFASGLRRMAMSKNSLSRKGTRPSTPHAARDLLARRQS